jgi:hypothetical protein
MASPGKLTCTLLLLLSAQILPSLEISLDASIRNGTAVVSSRIVDFQGDEVIRLLDSGKTIRLTWVFRLAGLEETVVRYVHRDFLGDGYLIYRSGPEGDSIPLDITNLLRKLPVLDNIELPELGFWEEGNTLDCRLYFDRDLLIPPMSIRAFFGQQRDRSSWKSVTYSMAAVPG